MKRLVILLLAAPAGAAPHPVVVTGTAQHQTVQSDGGVLTVTGSDHVIQVRGPVSRLTVTGTHNQITCNGPLTSFTLTGSHNRLRCIDPTALQAAECRVTGTDNEVDPPLTADAPTSPATPEQPPVPLGPIVGSLAFFLALFGGIFALARWSKGRVAAQMQSDARLPERLWCRGAFGILCTDSLDYAYLSQSAVYDMLRQFWDIRRPEDLNEQVRELEQTEPNAWNLVRAMLLARAAVAAGWWSQSDSWARCQSLGRRLQALYPDWTAMSEDLLRSRRLWRNLPADGSRDRSDDSMPQIHKQLAHVRAQVWPQTPWRTPL